MIYEEEKSSGIRFPLIVILIAIAAICGALVVTAEHPSPARVFVPAAAISHDRPDRLWYAWRRQKRELL